MSAERHFYSHRIPVNIGDVIKLSVGCNQFATLKAAEQERLRLQRAQEEAERKHQEAQARALATQRTEVEQQRAEAEARQHATTQARTTAHEAAKKAAERPKTFDFHGVAQHLKNPHQIDVFRELATSEGVRRQLPVEQQAPLARQLAEYARERGRHLSGDFIYRNFTSMLAKARVEAQVEARRHQRSKEEEDQAYALESALLRFAKHLRGLSRAGEKIAALQDVWPDDAAPPGLPFMFREDLHEALTIVTRLAERLHYDTAD